MVTLVPMAAAQFGEFSAATIRDYAADKIANGLWSAAMAPGLAHAAFAELLPQGLATPGHRVYCIRTAGMAVALGTLWIAEQERAGRRVAYVYGVNIHPAYRRKGYATQAFQALEAQALTLGLSGIALHVFGRNRGAQELYRRLGFQATDITLFKPLGGA
jgi:ribosomal protein S18 acetylase RimI-like enzyme